MSTRDRRLRERDELRGKIMDAARELFASYGYEAVTMRKLAERIEYTTAVIYGCFEDKNALIREICRVDFRSFFGSLAAIPADLPPVERLFEMGVAYVEFAIDKPNHYRLMFMDKLPDDLGDKPPGSGHEAYALFREAVADAWNGGGFREEYPDLELTSLLIWAGVHGVVSLYLALPEGHARAKRWPSTRAAARSMMITLINNIIILSYY